jgi:Cysteine-rich secretory protein family
MDNPPLDLVAAETAVLSAMNAERARARLPALHASPELGRAAHAYGDLLTRSDFSHAADTRGPAARAESAGYAFCGVAENLARHADHHGFAPRELGAAVVKGWMNSPPHRANLLNGSLVDVGVAVVATAAPVTADPPRQVFAVALYGRPQSLGVTFEVVNKLPGPARYTLAGKSYDIAGGHRVRHHACAAQRLTVEAGGKTIGTATSAAGLAIAILPGAGASPRLELSGPAGAAKAAER